MWTSATKWGSLKESSIKILIYNSLELTKFLHIFDAILITLDISVKSFIMLIIDIYVWQISKQLLQRFGLSNIVIMCKFQELKNKQTIKNKNKIHNTPLSVCYDFVWYDKHFRRIIPRIKTNWHLFVHIFTDYSKSSLQSLIIIMLAQWAKSISASGQSRYIDVNFSMFFDTK